MAVVHVQALLSATSLLRLQACGHAAMETKWALVYVRACINPPTHFFNQHTQTRYSYGLVYEYLLSHGSFLIYSIAFHLCQLSLQNKNQSFTPVKIFEHSQ